MLTKERWNQMSPERRRVVVIVGVIEAILKIAALRDLKRRPASGVRGPKWLWAASVMTVSSGGVLPVSYFLFGRKREPEPAEAA